MSDLFLSRLSGTLKSLFKINKLSIDASALTTAKTITITDSNVAFPAGISATSPELTTSAKIYNVQTDASNYERLAITGNTITVETAGTGADNIDLSLAAAGTGRVKLLNNTTIQGATSSDLIAFQNSTGTIVGRLQHDAGGGILFSNGTQTAKIYIGLPSATTTVSITEKLFIGTALVPATYTLSFSGNSAQTIGQERQTTANTAGNSLTCCAGGATVGATDKNGGQRIIKGGISTGTGESGVTLQGYVAGTTGTADCSTQDMVKVLGNKLGFYNVTPTVRPAALTTQLTTITHTTPGTPDYAIQDLIPVQDQGTGLTSYGFATQDEGNTVLTVIVNLQARVAELETKLQSVGLLT